MIKKLLIYIFIPTLLIIANQYSSFAQQEQTKTLSNEINRVSLYPIPADHKVTIKLNGIKEQVAQVQIVNVIGRVLKDQTILNKNTSEVTFTDLTDLPQGVYMVITKDSYGKILQSTRLIISR